MTNQAFFFWPGGPHAGGCVLDSSGDLRFFLVAPHQHVVYTMHKVYAWVGGCVCVHAHKHKWDGFTFKCMRQNEISFFDAIDLCDMLGRFLIWFTYNNMPMWTFFSWEVRSSQLYIMSYYCPSFYSCLYNWVRSTPVCPVCKQRLCDHIPTVVEETTPLLENV